MQKIMFNDNVGLTNLVLQGKKTQTRRFMTQGEYEAYTCTNQYSSSLFEISEMEKMANVSLLAKYGEGEVVGVAERLCDIMTDDAPKYVQESPAWTNKMFIKADDCIHFILINHVRIERLHDISDEDCFAEGIEYFEDTNEYGFYNYKKKNPVQKFPTPKEAYAALIDIIGKKGDWDSNPYVFVYNFSLED